jgi:hypothetical protein
VQWAAECCIVFATLNVERYDEIRRTSLLEISLDGSAPLCFLSSRVDRADLVWAPGRDELAYIYGEEFRVRNRMGTSELTVVSHRGFTAFRGGLVCPSISPGSCKVSVNNL